MAEYSSFSASDATRMNRPMTGSLRCVVLRPEFGSSVVAMVAAGVSRVVEEAWYDELEQKWLPYKCALDQNMKIGGAA
jgi:hypothetical protein